MDVKALNKRIDEFKTRNTKIAQDLHDLGMLCLEHLAAHNDTMPLNRLVLALVRGQHQPFGSWCMAFGAVVRTTDKKKAETQPLSFAKDKVTDLINAAEKPWYEFADDAVTGMNKAFDLQIEFRKLIKRAKDTATPQQRAMLIEMGKIASVDTSALVVKEEPKAEEPAAAVEGETAIV
jgi:hypothetical protein